jgi:Family of unknown function (DUF6065)
LIEFFHIFAEGPSPKPADPSIAGALSLRAYKYCESFVAANALGWYIYPAFDFDLRWDGHVCLVRLLGSNRKWSVLHTIIPPELSEQIAQGWPGGPKSCPGVFPFLSYAPEYGIVQVWPGLVVRTRPGWVSLVRPLANYPHEGAFEVLEGIIETDWWVGPLLSVLRVVKTDHTIQFRRTIPFAQLQLVHRDALADRNPDTAHSTGLKSWPEDVICSFGRVLNSFCHREKPGEYKRSVRARREP